MEKSSQKISNDSTSLSFDRCGAEVGVAGTGHFSGVKATKKKQLHLRVWIKTLVFKHHKNALLDVHLPKLCIIVFIGVDVII